MNYKEKAKKLKSKYEKFLRDTFENSMPNANYDEAAKQLALGEVEDKIGNLELLKQEIEKP